MDTTQIMSLVTAAAGEGERLYLLGGTSSDWSTGVGTNTLTVWMLMYNKYNKTYYWSDELDPPLGNNNYILI